MTTPCCVARSLDRCTVWISACWNKGGIVGVYMVYRGKAGTRVLLRRDVMWLVGMGKDAGLGKMEFLDDDEI